MNQYQPVKNLLLLERDRELRRIYKTIVSESGVNRKYLTREFIVSQLMKCSAPRFYISGHVACCAVTSYYKGKPTHQKKLKQAMVLDLVQVFEEVREAHLDAPMGEIWEMVVEHPAKSFYISPARILEIIFNWHDRK